MSFKDKFPHSCCNCKQAFSIVRTPRPGFIPRNPLVAKCGHSICELCVRTALKTSGTVMCSQCASTSTGDLSMDFIKKEFPYFKYLFGLWSLRSFYDDGNISFNMNDVKKVLNQEKKFDPCFDCPLPAFFTCNQCEVNYCKSCFEKVHVTKPQFINHTKSKAKPKNEIKKFSSIKQLSTLCKEHNNVKDFYCNDHNVAICSHCAIFQHSGHEVVAIGVRNEQAIPQLQESMRKAIEVVARISRIQKSVSAESAVKKFQSQSIRDLQAIEKEATARIARLNGILQAKENEIFNKIREERASLLGAYTQLEEELAHSKNSIESLLTEAKEAINKKGLGVNVHDLLKTLNEITQTVPSDICLENDQEPSEEASYRLENLSDLQMSTMFKEYLDNCFKISCPTLPKMKLISAKDISDQVRVEDSVKDSARISSLSRQYGVEGEIKEDTPGAQLSRSISRASIDSQSEKSEKAASSGRSSPLILSRTLSALKAGSAEYVSISHVTSPSEFYVYRKGAHAILMQHIASFKRYVSSCGPETPSSVTKGGFYLVPNPEDLNWHRGKVIQTNIEDFPNKARVHYIDLGFKKLVDLSKFKTIPARLSQEPPLAIQCSLFDCHPRGETWTDEARIKMLELSLGEEVMMHVMNVKESTLEVDVVRVSEANHVSIRDALIFLELASFLPSSVPVRQEAPKTPLCPKSQFTKGDILECQLSYTVSPSEFYCVELDLHYQQLLNMMNEMTNVYSDPAHCPEIIYNPVIGMPVAAKFSEDEKWYRAVITGLPGKRLIDVFYVDFGNRERVSFTDCRILLVKFQRMNTQAIHCNLCDILPIKSEKWPEEASVILDKLTLQPVRLLIEDVQLLDNQPQLSVVLFAMTSTADVCINALLVQEGFAISTGINSTTVSFNRVHNVKKLSKLRDFCNQPDIEKVSQMTAELAAKQEKKAKKPKAKKEKVKDVEEKKDDVQAREEREPSRSASVTSESTSLKAESVDSEATHRIEVRVLSAVSPGLIYVRLLEAEQYINKLNMSLDEFYTGSVPDPIAEWKKGTFCVAYNSDDGHWYRSIIREDFGHVYTVMMKDIGKECTVEKKHLRPIEEKFLKCFTDGSIRCHLAGVLAAGGGKWASYACERFSEELSKHESVFITKRGKINEETKSIPIELWVKHITYGGALEPDIEEWMSMNIFVVRQGLAIPDRTYEQYLAPAEDLLSDLKAMQQASSSDITSDSYVLSWLASMEDGRECKNSMEVKTIQVKKSKKRANTANLQDSIMEWKSPAPLENLDACLEIMPSYVDENCIIFFHEVSREDTLKQIEQALQQQYRDSKPQPQDMFWSAGQPCIAQYHSNSLWYRGKVLKVNPDNTYIVQFVDYGNIEECRAHELRKRVFLANQPTYCHRAILHDLKPVSSDGKWPTNVLDFIHSNIVDKLCKVKLEEPEKPGDPYIAVSFGPPGGIELGDILVGMLYAVRASETVEEEDSSSTISDTSDDVVVVSSQDKDDVDSEYKNAKTLPDETIESIVASIVKPEFDLAGLSKSAASSVAEETTYVSQDSDSSEVGDKILLQAPDGAESSKVAAINANSPEISEFTIESLVAQSGEVLEELLNNQVENFIKEDESVALPKLPEKEVEEKKVPISLVKRDEFGAFLKLPVPDTENTLTVEVTAIAGLTAFFVQINKTSNDSLLVVQNEYKEMFNEMQAEAPSGRPLLDTSLKIGQECCALYEEDNCWYRSVIVGPISEKEEVVMVTFVDFGNKQLTPVKNLRPLKRKWMDVPMQCFCVNLAGVEKVEGTCAADAFKVLTEIIFCPLVAVVKEFGHPMKVELYKEGTHDLVYQPLIDQGFLSVKKN